MKRILALVLVAAMLLPSTFAAEGQSETPVVTLSHNSNVPYLTTTYWQGDTIHFNLYFPTQGSNPEAVGLVAAGTAISSLYDSNGTIDKGKFLYQAVNSYNEISLDTTQVAPGEYRFVYLSPMKSAYGEQTSLRVGYAFYDVTILPAETPSDWARSEVTAATNSYLIPAALSNRYQAPITRDHFALLLNALVSSKTAQDGDGVGLIDLAARRNLSVSDNPFEDINHRYFGDNSHNYIVAANKLGIINGVSETQFSPNGLLTRQEAAAMLWRTANALGLTFSATPATFSDMSAVADWAKEGVSFVSSQAIMTGGGDGRFDPLGTYTYQQAYLTTYRMLQAMKGQTTNSDAQQPSDGTQPMSVPFTAAGHEFTILSVGSDEPLSGNRRNAAAGETFFAVTFVESNPDKLSYTDLLTVYRQAYLEAPDGTKYYGAYEDPWDIYVNRTMGFFLPASLDTSTLVFVIAGQARELK